MITADILVTMYRIMLQKSDGSNIVEYQTTSKEIVIKDTEDFSIAIFRSTHLKHSLGSPYIIQLIPTCKLLIDHMFGIDEDTYYDLHNESIQKMDEYVKVNSDRYVKNFLNIYNDMINNKK